MRVLYPNPEGPSSPFLEHARELLSRAVLPEAGRAASLATNDAWRSAEYRLGLRCGKWGLYIKQTH